MSLTFDPDGAETVSFTTSFSGAEPGQLVVVDFRWPRRFPDHLVHGGDELSDIVDDGHAFSEYFFGLDCR